MISNSINLSLTVLDTLVIGTTNGLTFIHGTQQKKILENVNVKDIKLINESLNNSELIIQTNNSFYKINYNQNNFNISEQLIYINNKNITSCFVQGNLIYYGEICNDSNLILNILNFSTSNNQKKVFNNLSYNSILYTGTKGTNLLLVTKNSLIEYNPNTDVIINNLPINYTPTCFFFDNTNFYIGTYENLLITYDNNLVEVSQQNFNSKINQIFKENSDIYISTNNGFYINNVLVNNFYTKNANYNNGNIYQNTKTKIIDQNTQNVFEEKFNRNNLANYPVGEYQSKAINIPLNTALAGFTWTQSGPINNYQTGLATSQSTNSNTFSDFTNFSLANKGTYVVGITNLTQAIKFAIQINTIDSLLESPIMSQIMLNTSTLPIEAIEPYQLKKSETLVVHTSYPQKFFENSKILTEHDASFKKNYNVDTNNLSEFESVPYGFQYQLKSQTKDQFARYSKESYNPLSIDYTSAGFPLTAAPVQNVSFTVLNPEEIFVSWDPVTELIDTTPIPGDISVRYKILRKSDSNEIYKIVHADGLISLNKTYITSIDPITNDIGQLVDGICEPTHFEQDSVLEFDDNVEITTNLDVVYNISKIILTFVKGYEPQKVELQVINGSLVSETYIFDCNFFTSVNDRITSLCISDIGFSGDKIKISYIKRENINIKILEHEIYRGLSNNEILTYYRDEDIDFQNGSQYYYRVIAELNQITKPTNYQRETKIISVGDPQAILGIIDSGNFVYQLTLENNSISQIIRKDNFPQKLQGASAVNIGEYIIVTGGSLENNQANLATDNTYLANTNQLNFSQRTGMRSNKIHHTSFIKNSYLFTTGGIYDNFNKLPTNEILRSRIGINQNTLSIFDSVATLPTACYGHSTFIYNDIFYVLGGITDNEQYLDQSYGATFNNTINNLDPWFINSSLPLNIAFACVQPYGNQIFLVGGKTQDNQGINISRDIYRADIIGQQISNWTKIGTLPKPLYGSSSFIKDNKIFIIGGISNSEILSNNIFSIEIDTNGDILNVNNELDLPYTTAFAPLVTVDDSVYIITGAINNGVSLGQTIEI